jgi:Na+/H+ antiporter NhaC
MPFLPKPLLILTWICLLAAGTARAQDASPPETMLRDFTVKPVVRSSGEAALSIRALGPGGDIDREVRGWHRFYINTDTADAFFIAGRALLPQELGPGVLLVTFRFETGGTEQVRYRGRAIQRMVNLLEDDEGVAPIHIPTWLSILPPLMAILMALIFKEVVLSLVAGIWLGAFTLYGFRIEHFFHSIFRVVDTYFVVAITDPDRLAVIIFSLLIGGMVAIISRNGGMAGVVQRLSRYASSSRNAGLITWLLGIAIFFDDYANTLIVGNTMRPVTDRFRISREKLAYIVDSTAAPVASIAFVTTWIGAELGYISSALATIGMEQGAYSIFVHSLQYAFYPVLTLLFIFFLVRMGRDFGPMRKAELRARQGEVYRMDRERTGEGPVDDALRTLEPVSGIRYRIGNALWPILTVVGATIVGLFITGNDPSVKVAEAGLMHKLTDTLGNADSFRSLLWGSTLGVMVAIALSLLTRTLSLRYTMETLLDGFKTMVPAVVIMVLAWSLANVTQHLHTAGYLSSVFSGNVLPQWMPLLTFVMAALISFSTGSSWSTMAILYPLVLPTTWVLCMEAGIPHEQAMHIFYNVTAVVLGGSVLGDHCSPISDTTVLSSLASSCNHIDHVRTQLPYALAVGAIAAFIGGVFFFLHLPWYVDYAVGIMLVFLLARFAGRRVPVVYVDTSRVEGVVVK